MKLKRVFFTEAEDKRVLQAARYLKDKGLAEPFLCAKPFKLRELADKNKISTRGLAIHPPLHDPDFRMMVKELQKVYKNRNLNINEAEKILEQPLWYGIMSLKTGKTDMVLSGNINQVKDILKAAFSILDSVSKNATVSGYVLINAPGCSKRLLFSDCTVNPDPSAEQLAQIAISSAATFE